MSARATCYRFLITPPDGGMTVCDEQDTAGNAGTFTSVSAAWTQPAVTCTATNTFASFWAGLDGDGTIRWNRPARRRTATGAPRHHHWLGG